MSNGAKSAKSYTPAQSGAVQLGSVGKSVSGTICQELALQLLRTNGTGHGWHGVKQISLPLPQYFRGRGLG